MPQLVGWHIHSLYCPEAAEKGDQEAATINFALQWMKSQFWDVGSSASTEATHIKATLVAILWVDAWKIFWW